MGEVSVYGNRALQGGNVSIDEESEEHSRYKCQFCPHGFGVYSAYIIHVQSRHPEWNKNKQEKNNSERIDLQVAIRIQQESEDSDTVAILDENDENERTLVE